MPHDDEAVLRRRLNIMRARHAFLAAQRCEDPPAPASAPVTRTAAPDLNQLIRGMLPRLGGLSTDDRRDLATKLRGAKRGDVLKIGQYEVTVDQDGGVSTRRTGGGVVTAAVTLGVQS